MKVCSALFISGRPVWSQNVPSLLALSVLARQLQMRMGAIALACTDVRKGGTCMSKCDVVGCSMLRTKSRPTTKASPSISSKSAVQTTRASLWMCRGRSVLLDIYCFPLVVRHI